MTEKQKKDCKKIINVASASAAVGGGLAQIPGSDEYSVAAKPSVRKNGNHLSG